MTLPEGDVSLAQRQSAGSEAGEIDIAGLRG